MLRAALAFLVIALIAAVFGFSGIANISADMAWIVFFVFLCLAVVSFLANGFRGRTVEPI